MWLTHILFSAVLLAFYDASIKHGIRANAVFAVLLPATLCGALALAAFLGATSGLADAVFCEPAWVWRAAVKAALASGSWACMFYALRALPISIATPIQSSTPLWTLLGAILLFGEAPSRGQAAGMALVLAGYLAFAFAGRREGVPFTRGGVVFAFAGTLLGATSALFDKHLFGVLQGPRGAVQLWAYGWTALAFASALWIRHAFGLARTPFTWRWTIPQVGILLAASDFLYFAAVGAPGTQIAIVSLLRRTSVVAAFLLGVFVFKERNIARKALALAILLAGVAVLCLA